MAYRTLVKLSVTALLASLVAGCGTVSSQSSATGSSTARHASSATARPVASKAPAAAATPPGFVRYVASGFSFLAPAGYKPATGEHVSGAPAGASITFLTPGGESIERANTEIIEGVNPHLSYDIDQVVANLRGADTANRALKQVSTDVAGATVPGAEEARVVTERYIGPRPTTLYRRTWLMVVPRPGVLIDLVVADEPWRGGALNPATVLGSFRLGS